MNCRTLLVAFALVLFSKGTLAQKGINSIYSAYGIGDYQLRDQNANMGMGNVGVAMPSFYSVNETNPASFAWLPKDNFKLEMTLAGLTTNYLNEKVNTQAGNFTLSRIALSAQVVNPVRTVIGLKRLSQVEYYTTSYREIAGTEDKLFSEVEGNGGLYQVYAGNALKIGKNLALGINTGIIFGSVNSRETVALNTEESLISEVNKYYNQASLTGGVQYQIGTKKSRWMLGAFYEPQIKLNVATDTKLKNQNDELITEKPSEYSKFIYPQKFGVGLAYSNQSLTASVDMIGHLWEATGYKGTHFSSTDAYSFSAGVRHQFMRTTVWGTALGIAVLAGFNRDQSYLVINGRQIISNAFTLGAVFPSRNNLNFYSAGCKIGTRGVATYPLVKENFFEFNFNLSLGGVFYKVKKYD